MSIVVGPDDRLPWEKQPGESVPAFQAFTLYRDNLGNWSMRRVAEDIGKNRALIEKWGREHHWRERLEQYLLHVDRRMREARESEAEKENRNALALGRAVQGLVAARVMGRAEKEGMPAVLPLDPNEISARDVPNYVTAANRLIRVALGQPVDFARGAIMPKPSDVEQIARDMIQLAYKHLPPERHPAYLEDLQTYFHGGSAEVLALSA